MLDKLTLNKLMPATIASLQMYSQIHLLLLEQKKQRNTYPPEDDLETKKKTVKLVLFAHF